MLKLKAPVVRKVTSGVVLERVLVICPACGQQVEAVARDGQVSGYCGVARQYVNFETRKNRLKRLWQDLEGRDSSGHFVKGNVPWNKRFLARNGSN